MTAVRRPWIILPLLALVVWACEGEGPVDPDPVASSIEVVDGAGQSGPVGEPLAQAVVLGVRDGDGETLADVPVTVEVLSGGGSVADGPSFISDSEGRVYVSWTLGTTPGEQSLRASIAGDTALVTAIAHAGVVTLLEKISGDAQQGAAGTTLPNPIVVRASDAFGNPVAGATVVWSAPAGGSVSPIITETDANGLASTSWQLGNNAGAQSVTAAVGSVTASFSAAVIAGAGASIERVSGDGQSAQSGAELAASLVVRVRDAFGNPVPGVSITWTPNQGGEALPASSVTDASGLASTRWRLGAPQGTQTMTAASGSLATSFTAAAGGGGGVQAAELVPIASPASATVAGTISVRVQARDVTGNVVPGVVVSWTALDGAGTPTPSLSTTDASGVAETFWTLGTTAGQQRIQASIPADADTIVTTAVAGPAARIEKVSGDGLRERVASNLHDPLIVQVFDQYGNTVTGEPVDWLVPYGGFPSSYTPETQEDGIAEAIIHLGTVAGGQTVTAHIDVDSVSFTVFADPGPAASVHITPDTVVFTTIGDTAQLSATAADAYGNPITPDPGTWTSDAPAAASVDGNRVVTSNMQGLALVIGTWGTLADTAVVRVEIFGGEDYLEFIRWTTNFVDARLFDDAVMIRAWTFSHPYGARLYDVSERALQVEGFVADGGFDLGSDYGVWWGQSWHATAWPVDPGLATGVDETLKTIATSGDWVAYEHWTGQSRFDPGTFHAVRIQNMLTREIRTISTTGRLPGTTLAHACGGFPSFSYPHLAVLDSGTYKIFNVETGASQSLGAAVSGDVGGRVAVDNGRVAWPLNGEIMLRDLTTGSTTNITALTGVGGSCPSLSGNHLVWVGGHGYVYELSTGSLRSFVGSEAMTVSDGRILRRVGRAFRLLTLH